MRSTQPLSTSHPPQATGTHHVVVVVDLPPFSIRVLVL